MATINIIHGNSDYAEAIAKDIRAIDAHEIWAAIGQCPLDGLIRSFDQSEKSWVGFIDDELFGCWGVSSTIEEGVGSPWFIGTHRMDESSNTIAFRTKKYIDDMFENFDYLYNYVHNNNIISQRWLNWIGFIIEGPAKFGVKGELFRRFILSKEDWRAKCVIQ